MDRSPSMKARPDKRNLVRDLCVLGEDLRQLNPIRDGRDRLERTANLCWRIGLHIKRIELTGRPKIEDENARPFIFGGIYQPRVFSLQQLRQT